MASVACSPLKKSQTVTLYDVATGQALQSTCGTLGQDLCSSFGLEPPCMAQKGPQHHGATMAACNKQRRPWLHRGHSQERVCQCRRNHKDRGVCEGRAGGGAGHPGHCEG